MHVYRPSLTHHRLQRLILWALAMLHWMAAVLFGDRPLALHHLARLEDTNLNGLARMAAGLIVERALNLLRRAPRRGRRHYWRHGRSLRRRHWMRSLLGSKLRRALTHKDVATQIAQLIAVFRNLDAWAAHIARRIRSGMRRLWSTAPPMSPAAMILGLPASPPACADSS